MLNITLPLLQLGCIGFVARNLQHLLSALAGFLKKILFQHIWWSLFAFVGSAPPHNLCIWIAPSYTHHGLEDKTVLLHCLREFEMDLLIPHNSIHAFFKWEVNTVRRILTESVRQCLLPYNSPSAQIFLWKQQQPPISDCSFIWNNSIGGGSTVRFCSHYIVCLCFLSFMTSFQRRREGSLKWFEKKKLTCLPCGLYLIFFTFSAHFLLRSYQELGSQQEAESAGMYHYILKMAYLLLLPAGSCFCPSKCSGVWKRQLHLTGWPFNSHDYLLSIHNYYRWWFPSITISYSRL